MRRVLLCILVQEDILGIGENISPRCIRYKNQQLAKSSTACQIPETGGILGVSINDPHTVTAFHFDSTGRTERSTYTPDVGSLNRVIADWAENGIEFVGFVHSHPKEDCKLSKTDIEYADKIKKVCSMSLILMVIYLPDTEEIYPYVI